MSKTKKLVYQVFNCKNNEVEERTLTVTNKETARLATLGIEYERKKNLGEARTLFYYAFIELCGTYFKSDINVNLKQALEERRSGINVGPHQKIDIVLESTVNNEKYAIKLVNTSFINMVDCNTVLSRAEHAFKQFNGNLYTIKFKDFISAAANVINYVSDFKFIFKKLKSLGMLKKSRKIPSDASILSCLDNAVESTINDCTVDIV